MKAVETENTRRGRTAKRRRGRWMRPGFIRSLAVITLGSAAAASLYLVQDVRAGAARGIPVAPGVTTRQLNQGLATVRVIDVDLSRPGVRVQVAADEIGFRDRLITGRARTVEEWVARQKAVAGINGGFFGKRHGENHKEIVGLLKLDGRVRVAAPVYRSRPERIPYARSAFGLTEQGRPRMAWVTSRPGDPQALRSHAEPQFRGNSTTWNVRQALACGPRLIHAGKTQITARGERLASPGALPRTFLGYSVGRGGKPGHLALCTTDSMEFEDCARFLADYFRRYHGTSCQEAMALDGGASTQAVWKEAGSVKTQFAAGVTVPTAILVFSKGGR